MAESVRPRAYRVSEISYYLKEYLAEDAFLQSVAVQGEVSGCRLHSSGHLYFTLRERECGLKTVFFRRYASALKVVPRDGEQVIVVGRIALFERDGACQLYGEALLPAGQGLAAQAREELRARLQAEGLFDQERKQPLPRFAQSVGLVTAPKSAALADMQRILYTRQPGVKLRIYPALVQGAQAPASLTAALARADKGRHDVIICGRGGGSGEDLSAFDSEQVVRAVAALHTPVICAVGHESDFSLADLAADVRAATPTHAATLAVPDAAELFEQLELLEQRLRRAADRCLHQAAGRLQALASRQVLTAPEVLLQGAERRLQQAEQALRQGAAAQLTAKQQRLAGLASRLELLSPLQTLERGYALVSREGRVLRASRQTARGELLEVRLYSGGLLVRVEDIIDGAPLLGLTDRSEKDGQSESQKL